jgi:hypothetical protein
MWFFQGCRICGRIPTNWYELSIFGFLFLQNETTNQIFRDLDSRIWICESTKQIFKDSFCGIVLKIREDSLDSWKQVESLKICWICGQWFNSNLLKPGFVLWSPNRIFKSPDLWYEATGTRFPDMNLATLDFSFKTLTMELLYLPLNEH